MVILSAKGLVKRYGKKIAVAGVNIEVKDGEVVGLLGPNGAGKTTTFYMMIGVIRPNNGNVFIDDMDITKMPMHKRARLGIGYLPQEPSVFRGLTVRDNLLAVLEFTSSNKSYMLSKLDNLLKEMQIHHLANQKVTTLSGGERRRTEIARSLATDPKFLLLDEPFSGIDPIVVGELQKLIIGLKSKGIGILITDHNVREVLTIVDRAYIIYQGKILIEGTSEFLLNDQRAREIYLGEEFRM